VSPAYEIADLQELLRSNKNARFQQEVTRFVLQRQLADLQAERSTLNTKANKTRVEEVDNMISNIKQAISQADQAILMQDIKAEFAEVRIPVDRDHRFRLIAIIQSVRSRSCIPVDRDHRFR
jgi:hypothetical protein